MDISQAESFLDSKGLTALTRSELDTISQKYHQDLLRGLNGKGDIKMYHSLLKPVAAHSINGTSLVIEVGGTNFYAARVSVNREAKIEDKIEKTLPKKEFQDADEFYNLISTLVTSLDCEGIQAFGIVYSFAGQAVRTLSGVDIKSPEKLSKGFKIPGISQQLVGESLLRVLSKNLKIPQNLPLAVLNDTVAVLFSVGASIGGVVGTGFNLAVNIGGEILNTESGGFNPGISSKYLSQIDRDSTNKGQQLVEKNISGFYLGKLFKLIADDLNYQVTDFSPEMMSQILFQEQNNISYLICSSLRDRSAQLVGTMVGTLINTFPDSFPTKSVVVPIEGSLFWKMPMFMEIARNTAQDRSQKELLFLNIPNAGRIGAAVAALSQLR